ncbi:hypothetical protein ACUXNR_002210 [Staphylococcus hominis]
MQQNPIRDKEQINTLNRLLENQLEEERQLNYSFDIATNNKQNISPQEVTFTEESQNINQQQKNINQLKKIIRI